MKKILSFILFILITIAIFSGTTDSVEPVIHKKPEKISAAEQRSLLRDPPVGEEIVNPAEFGRADGVFLAWSGWGIDTITDIAYAVAEDFQVYMLVANTYYQTIAYDHLTANSVNMENVSFILDNAISSSSMWIRDYGPFYIYEDGDRGIIDFVYGTYQTDDFVPITIANYFGFPYYSNNLVHHGGNHITDGNGMAFCSTNIYNYNPGYSQEQISNDFRDYLGMDSLIVIAPMNGDGTGHIDMFCKLLSDTLFIVGEYESAAASYPGDYELLNNLAVYLDSLTNIDGRDFQVERIIMPPFYYGGPAGTINYTYTNSLIINDKVLVPIYGFETDDEALNTYARLMPEHEIIGLNSSFIIQYWGATHCITNLHHSQNPLIVLHGKIDSLEYNVSPQIKFRLNPKFESSQASVFYKLESEEFYTEIPASLFNGTWNATLPGMTENFNYYIYGEATSGENEFETTLPENAPFVTFEVNVENVFAQNNIVKPFTDLSNFPNPFNPETTISFNLTAEDAKDAEILIYNVRGQKIRKYSIFNPSNAGQVFQSSMVWDGKDMNNESVSSGIYFYKLKTSSFERTNKMILMK